MWKSLIYIVTIQHYKFCQRTVSIFLEPLLGAINTTLYKNLRHHCSGAKDDIVQVLKTTLCAEKTEY